MTNLLALPLVLASLVPTLQETEEPTRGAGPGAILEPRSPLERIGLQLMNLEFEMMPWVAEERRWWGRPYELGTFGSNERVERSKTLDRLTEELHALRGKESSPMERSERAALEARVRAEHASYQTRNPERWNADHHVRRVERVLRTKFLSPRRPSTLRGEALQIIQLLPSYWQEARSALISPEVDWNERAATRLSSIELDLDGVWREKIKEDMRDKEDRVDRVFDKAVAATASFREWLEQRPGGIGGATLTLDAPRWESLVQAETGTPWNIAEIKWNVLRDLAHAERDHGTRWRDRATGDEIDDEVFTDLDDILGLASLEAVDLAARAGLLPIERPEEVLHYSTTDVMAQRFGVPAILMPGKDTTLQVLLNPGELAGADEATLKALGLRYGFPGVALLQHEGQTADRLLPRFLWNRSLSEGWGLYVLEWIHEVEWVTNVFAEDAAFEAEAVRQRVLEGARLMAALEIHGEGYTLEAAAEGFSRRTGIDLDRSMDEARLATVDPLRGIGFLGYVELKKRERVLEESSDYARALGQMVAETLASPHLRPVDRP